MSMISVHQSITADGNIQIDITNVSGRRRAEGVMRRCSGMSGISCMDEEEECSLIISLRSTQPQLFFYLAPQNRGGISTTDSLAPPQQQQQPQHQQQQSAMAVGGISRLSAFTVPSHRSSSGGIDVSNSGIGASPAALGSEISSSVAEASHQTWQGCGLPPVGTIDATVSDAVSNRSDTSDTIQYKRSCSSTSLQHREAMLINRRDSRPILIREALPDCILLPGERRIFVLLVSHPHLLWSTRNGGPPSTASSEEDDGDVETLRQHHFQHRRRLPTGPLLGSSASVSELEHTTIYHGANSSSILRQQQKSRLMDSSRLNRGGNSISSRSSNSALETSTKPLSIIRDTSSPSHPRHQLQHFSGSRTSLNSTDLHQQSSGCTSVGDTNSSTTGDRSRNAAVTDALFMSSTRPSGYTPSGLAMKSVLPTLYIYYAPLGDDNKCVDRARKWLRKEEKAYDVWRDSTVSAVVELEKQREQQWPQAVDGRVMPPQPLLQSRRILAPALGESVRWRPGGEDAEAQLQPSPITAAAYRYYFPAALGAPRLRAPFSLSSKASTATVPPSFASTRQHLQSLKAKRIFKDDRKGGGTVMVLLRRRRRRRSSMPAVASILHEQDHRSSTFYFPGPAAFNQSSGGDPLSPQQQHQSSSHSHRNRNHNPAEVDAAKSVKVSKTAGQSQGGGSSSSNPNNSGSIIAVMSTDTSRAMPASLHQRMRSGRGLALLEDSMSFMKSPRDATDAATKVSSSVMSSCDYLSGRVDPPLMLADDETFFPPSLASAAHVSGESKTFSPQQSGSFRSDGVRDRAREEWNEAPRPAALQSSFRVGNVAAMENGSPLTQRPNPPRESAAGGLVSQLLTSFAQKCGKGDGDASIRGASDGGVDDSGEEAKEESCASPRRHLISSAPPQTLSYQRRKGVTNGASSATDHRRGGNLQALRQRARVAPGAFEGVVPMEWLADRSKRATGRLAKASQQLATSTLSASTAVMGVIHEQTPTVLDGLSTGLSFVQDVILTPHNVDLLQSTMTPLILLSSLCIFLYLLFSGQGDTRMLYSRDDDFSFFDSAW